VTPEAILHDGIAVVVGGRDPAALALPLRHTLDENVMPGTVVLHSLDTRRGNLALERLSAAVAFRHASLGWGTHVRETS
jgi:hypothetical protein